MFKNHHDEAPPDPDRLLTAAEVSRLLHISRSLLYDLIQQGDIPSLHIGRAVRFRWQDLQEYIREQSNVLRLRRSRQDGRMQSRHRRKDRR